MSKIVIHRPNFWYVILGIFRVTLNIVYFLEIFHPTNLCFHLKKNDFRKVVESCSGRGTSIFTVWQKIVCERTDRKEFCRLV